VQDGKLLPAATAAQQRGVIIDVGHGAGSFDYTIAEAALAQGLIPDTISSDLHALTLNGPGKGFLPWVMSKFLNLGFELEQVVKMVTINPARVVGRVEKLGTLRIGAPADVAIMQLVEEPVEFVDTKRNTRKGTRYLKPLHTIRAGRPFGPPFPIPYGYP
jgi:dihydroorotase